MPSAPDPQGYITYTRDGRVMVFIVGRERMRPAALVPTDEEKIALYDTMFAYAGTFTFDSNKVVQHSAHRRELERELAGNKPDPLL